jgi:hypothetical protein
VNPLGSMRTVVDADATVLAGALIHALADCAIPQIPGSAEEPTLLTKTINDLIHRFRMLYTHPYTAVGCCLFSRGDSIRGSGSDEYCDSLKQGVLREDAVRHIASTLVHESEMVKSLEPLVSALRLAGIAPDTNDYASFDAPKQAKSSELVADTLSTLMVGSTVSCPSLVESNLDLFAIV